MSKLLDTLDPTALAEADAELVALRAEHPAYPDYELLLYANARARERAALKRRNDMWEAHDAPLIAGKP